MPHQRARCSFAHKLTGIKVFLVIHQHDSMQALCQRGQFRAAAPVHAHQCQQQHSCPLPKPAALHHVWGLAPSCSTNGRPAAQSCCCRVVSPEQPAPAPAAIPATDPVAAATLSVTQSLGSLDESNQATSVPEDFELGPGVLSPVDRTSPPAPEDAYRCPGCTKPECQVRAAVQDQGVRCVLHLHPAAASSFVYAPLLQTQVVTHHCSSSS